MKKMKKGDTTTMNRLVSRPRLGTILLAIVGILAIVLPAAGNWSILQERDPEVRDYMSIAFTSKNIGWVVGAASLKILKILALSVIPWMAERRGKNRKSKSAMI